MPSTSVASAIPATERTRAVVFSTFGAFAVLVALLMVRESPGLTDDVLIFVLLSLIGGVITALWPSLDYALLDRPMECLVAFVGCDGAGKSTLTEDMRRRLARSIPVQTCYLGLGSGTIGERIRKWPVIGSSFERRLSRRADKSRTSGHKIPGLSTAVVIYIFSLLRLRRFKRMLSFRRNGFIVLTDRYPQIEVPGIYDGPGLSAGHAGSRSVALLVEQERRMYRWMTAFHPDVIVRLNVTEATALRRKPDHRADLIARKIAVTPILSFGGARLVDLDAEEPYPVIRESAYKIIINAIGADKTSPEFQLSQAGS